MKWVKDKPTKEGWYWAKIPSLLDGQPYVRVVHVYHTILSGFAVYEDGDNYRLETYNAIEWSDEPIPEPEPKFVEKPHNVSQEEK